MKVNRIRLENFRNFAEREIDFGSSGAFFLGPNGSGKTNLLEALAYASLGKSCRYQADELLIQKGARKFSLAADFQLVSGKYKLNAEYSPGQKKFFINRNQIRNLSCLYSYLKAIYCSPDDVYLINGNPRRRRQHFDLAIAQLRPPYITQLRHYIHITEQRNTLLKNPINTAQKKHWDILFLKAMHPVIEARFEYLQLINGILQEKYGDVLTEANQIRISYLPNLNISADTEANMAELHAIANREWQYQRTLCGPHLDDYSFILRGHHLKEIGSQGQKRTVTMLLKIGHLELVKNMIGEYPILLLDDVFAELDETHIVQLMQVLSSHEQIFVASPRELTGRFWPELPVVNLEAGSR